MSDAVDPFASELPDLFAELIELGDPQCRARLDQLRAINPALAARLEELLVAHRETDAFLSRPFARPGLSAPLSPGDEVDAFRVESAIGSGANGSVYRARQTNPDRVVALKVLHFALPSTGAVVRFRREVRMLARLSHPGIITLIAAGVIDPEQRALAWFAMEFVEDAKSIRNWSADLPLERKVAAIAQACDAIQHAHDAGVIHRDLKPGNILIGVDGRPRVIDFGVATWTGASAMLATRAGSITPDGAIIGTIAYMSPEQFKSPSEIDARSDVYALGMILYEICTGRLPYDLGSTVAQSIRAIMLDEPLDPARAAPTEDALGGDLGAVISKAIQRAPDQRYATAADLAADLRRWLAHQRVLARRPGLLHQAVRIGTTRPYSAAAVGLLLLGAGAWFAWTRNQPSIASTQEPSVPLRSIAQVLADYEGPSANGEVREARILKTADDAVRQLDAGTLPPTEEATDRMAVGRLYQLMGLLPQAREQYRLAVTLRSQLTTDTFGPIGSETLNALSSLARAAALESADTDARDQSPAEPLVAARLRDIIAALGWTDARTLDALEWSVPAISDQDLRALLGDVARSPVPDAQRLRALGTIIGELATRSKLDARGEDRALFDLASDMLAAALRQEPRTAVRAGTGLARALIDAGRLDDAKGCLDLVLPIALAPEFPAESHVESHVESHAELDGDRRRLAELLLAVGRPADALAINDRILARVDTSTYAGRALRDGAAADAARALIMLSRTKEARATLAYLDSEGDHSAGLANDRRWRAVALASYARTLTQCGEPAEARRIAFLANTVAATLPRFHGPAKDRFTADLSEAASVPH